MKYDTVNLEYLQWTILTRTTRFLFTTKGTGLEASSEEHKKKTL